MNWSETFPKTNQPTMGQVGYFVDSPLWTELCTHVQERYGVVPQLFHSGCGMAPGWNVKYRKGGKAICTLYPAAGTFTALISIGEKLDAQAQRVLTGCQPEVQRLYEGTTLYNHSRWLSIAVDSPAILEDVKALLSLRME